VDAHMHMCICSKICILSVLALISNWIFNSTCREQFGCIIKYNMVPSQVEIYSSVQKTR